MTTRLPPDNDERENIEVESPAENPPNQTTTPKKRKRDAKAEDEALEIDLSLPEPLSKKALRKSTKERRNSIAKPNLGPAHDGAVATAEDQEPLNPEENRKRSEWSVWIGNLPWTATKQDVCDFITMNAGLDKSAITRINMPAPQPGQKTRSHGPTFYNKGFAYVDFDCNASHQNALAITETKYPGNTRHVLVKDSKNFEGRPEEHKTDGRNKGSDKNKSDPSKPPSKRIFVGNLNFDTTKDSLWEHYSQCGTVADVFLATFEDSGKSKGFAWVTFESLEASEAAVRGWVMKASVTEIEIDDAEEPVEEKAKPKSKPTKWFVNRYHGRMLRVEYAEGADVRYNKRYGKGAKGKPRDGDDDAVMEDDAGTEQQKSSAHDRRRDARKAKKDGQSGGSAKPTVDSEPRKTNDTVAVAQGKRITFGDE